MKAVLNILEPSREFTTKRGKQAFVASATFDDEGARFPVGRAKVYSDKPLGSGAKVTGVLTSYGDGDARFSAR